ncbi:DsbA family protein [Guggenheimella bovis]
MIRLIYFTDTVDVNSWAIDADLITFYYRYRHQVQISFVMGVMLDEWAKEKKLNLDTVGDIYRAWRDTSEYSNMPVSGSLWLRDPIHTSYPSAKVFNVVEAMYPQYAFRFFRRLQEAAFVFDQNISRESILESICKEFPFDEKKVINLSTSKKGKELMDKDFEMVRKYKVNSFPTIIFEDGKSTVRLEEEINLENLENAASVFQLKPEPVPELKKVLREMKRLYTKEISMLYEVDPKDVNRFVEEQKVASSEWKEFYEGFYLEDVRP